MSKPSLKLSNAASFDLGGDVLLFVESSGRLILLNETASSIWRGLESAMSVAAISEELAARTGCSREQAARDCAHSIEKWQELGVFDTGQQSLNAAQDTAETVEIPDTTASGHMPVFGRRYRLLELSFTLRATHFSDARTIHDFIGHLEAQRDAPVDMIFDVIRSDDRYVLRGNGELVDECDDSSELVPMVHANLLLTAYRRSECMAALHAAAVARGKHCILMPGASGSGKSTLAAALLAHGFEYCTDDLVLLTDDPLRIRAFPMRMGLKSGAWRALATRWPEIEALPAHRRADGQSIRYFLPQQYLASGSHPSTYEPTRIVFPTYQSNGTHELRQISSGDALLRLTEAGYDLPNCMDRQVVSTLVDWLSATPCYELRYSRLDQAVDAVSMIGS